MNTTMKLWYEGKTGNHQGLVIEEGTGRTVAVTYEKTDAARIVRAVNSFDAMRGVLEIVLRAFNVKQIDPFVAFVTIEKVRTVLALADGENATNR